MTIAAFSLLFLMPELCWLACGLARQIRRTAARVPTHGMDKPTS